MLIEAYDVGLTTGKVTLLWNAAEEDIELWMQDVDMTSPFRTEYLPSRDDHTYDSDVIILENPAPVGDTYNSRFLYGVVYGLAEKALIGNLQDGLVLQYPIERRPYLKQARLICRNGTDALGISKHMHDALAHLLKYLHGKEEKIYEALISLTNVRIHIMR